MKIALACGGTGGHIFPGLATARVLQDRGHEVELWLAGKDIEKLAVKGWEGPVHTVKAQGLPLSPSPKSVIAAWRLLKVARTCKKEMQKNLPDVLLAMGSYASVGPICAAMRLDIPIVLHEANVLPGRTISMFSRWADAVAASFEETRFYLKRCRDLVITGMPLRRNLEFALKPQVNGGVLDRDMFTILVMGGSRGAQILNQLVAHALAELSLKGKKLQVVHMAGIQDDKEVRATYKQAGLPHQVHSFVDNMAPIYTNVDLAICRSGAATCTELSAFGVPALLIPYPHAAKDHQMYNARALEKAGAADVVAEVDLSSDWLQDYVGECLEDPGRLASMSAAARRLTDKSAAKALADLVEKTAMN